MLEAIAVMMHLAQAESLAQPARERKYYRARKHRPEPEEQWWVVPYEPPTTEPTEPPIVTHEGDATFQGRWSPLEPTPKGDRLDKDQQMP